MTSTVADLIVRCLENEGVRFVYGIPGEENIRLVDSLARSGEIRFVLVHHEQSASFMADIHGRLTGKAGVCLATLGPGAINLLLGTADAFTDSSPLVAISAQGGLHRIFKESHQVVDLVSMFRPITKWADTIRTPGAVPEMIRAAFKLAQTERPGPTYLSLPEDVEAAPVGEDIRPLEVNIVRDSAPSQSQVQRALRILEPAKRPIVLAGDGVVRDDASQALVRFSENLGIPVATTFMAKGVIPDDNTNSLGAVGFWQKDYVNLAFDEADVIICAGYDLQEFDPVKINPKGDKKILHIHRYAAGVDSHYHVAVGIEGSISESLDALSSQSKAKWGLGETALRVRRSLKEELDSGRRDDSFPLAPERIVADTRSALSKKDDIVLVDTGAVKMWMARLYPAYQQSTCLISNGLSAMAFAIPGAIAAKLLYPNKRVLAAVGDGAFLMSSQEIGTAIRENTPIVILIWVDSSYGLIKWKMELELGRHSQVDFRNPDFVKLAESYGARGYSISKAEELLPTLEKALDDQSVSVISCAVDYSRNTELTEKLSKLSL